MSVRAGVDASRGRHARSLGRWGVLAAAVFVVSWSLTAVGLPAATLLAAVFVGIGHALVTRTVLTLPRPFFVASQAVIGAAAGSLIQRTALQEVAGDWLPVVLFSLATLLLSVGLGIGLARVAEVDATTASFGMFPGGASGMVAISDSFGADDRLVAFMQYLRVVVIVTLIPIVAAAAFGASTGAVVGSDLDARDWIKGALFVLVAGVLGLLLARLARLPTGAVLGPMFVAAAINLVHDGATVVPTEVQNLALAGIGLHVGLRFTAATLQTAGRLLPYALTATVTLIIVCGVLGLALARIVNVSDLAGYLATTPGGLPVVLGVTTTTEADATFVVSLQVLRVFLVLAMAPLLVRFLITRRRRSGAA